MHVRDCSCAPILRFSSEAWQLALQQAAKFRTARFRQFCSSLKKESVANYGSIWTQFSRLLEDQMYFTPALVDMEQLLRNADETLFCKALKDVHCLCYYWDSNCNQLHSRICAYVTVSCRYALSCLRLPPADCSSRWSTVGRPDSPLISRQTYDLRRLPTSWASAADSAGGARASASARNEILNRLYYTAWLVAHPGECANHGGHQTAVHSCTCDLGRRSGLMCLHLLIGSTWSDPRPLHQQPRVSDIILLPIKAAFRASQCSGGSITDNSPFIVQRSLESLLALPSNMNSDAPAAAPPASK